MLGRERALLCLSSSLCIYEHAILSENVIDNIYTCREATYTTHHSSTTPPPSPPVPTSTKSFSLHKTLSRTHRSHMLIYLLATLYDAGCLARWQYVAVVIKRQRTQPNIGMGLAVCGSLVVSFSSISYIFNHCART